MVAVTIISALSRCQFVHRPLVWICNMISFGHFSVQAFPHPSHAIKQFPQQIVRLPAVTHFPGRSLFKQDFAACKQTAW